MSRKRLVLGSLAGAAAIHFAFLACTAINTASDAGGSDGGGMLDAAGDAIRDAVSDAVAVVMDAETPEASAQDATVSDTGAPACNCAAPGPPDYSFAFAFDRGMGIETPQADGSTLSASSIARINTAGVINTVADFTARHVVTQGNLSLTCTISWLPSSAGPLPVQTQARCAAGNSAQTPFVSAAATIEVYNDTDVVVRIPRVDLIYAVPNSSPGRFEPITYTNIVLRAHDPAAHYATPIRPAYRP